MVTSSGQGTGQGVGGEHAPVSEQLLYIDDILHVTCAVMPGPSVVRLVGEIDSTNAAELLHALHRARHIDDHLIVELGLVTFSDVAGARALTLFAEGGDVVFRDTPHQMTRLMRLLGLPSLEEQGDGDGCRTDADPPAPAGRDGDRDSG
jgi:anti-anti-sigma regulatory factor